MAQAHHIVDIVWKTSNVFELIVERLGVAFAPGDSMTISHSNSGQSRPYSIASGTEEDVLRFLIQKIPGGLVSNDLAKHRPGDSVLLSAPFGWFHPGKQGNGESMVFVATGTGVAPFLSYIRTPSHQSPSVCLYGARRVEDFLALDELKAHCAELHLAVSRDKCPLYHHGRVTDLLKTLTFEADTHFYLCGLDAMIDDVTSHLEARGIHFSHIHREVFFYASP